MNNSAKLLNTIFVGTTMLINKIAITNEMAKEKKRIETYLKQGYDYGVTSTAGNMIESCGYYYQRPSDTNAELPTCHI